MGAWHRLALEARGNFEIQLGTYIEAHELDQLAVAGGARLEALVVGQAQRAQLDADARLVVPDPVAGDGAVAELGIAAAELGALFGLQVQPAPGERLDLDRQREIEAEHAFKVQRIARLLAEQAGKIAEQLTTQC